MKHVKKFDNLNEDFNMISTVELTNHPNAANEYRELLDCVAEDIDKILKMNNINNIKQSLSAVYNMIINDTSIIKNYNAGLPSSGM